MRTRLIPLSSLVSVVLAFLMGVIAVGAPASASAMPASASAQRVTVERTGGYLGLHDVFVVNASDPAPEVPNLVSLASSPEFQSLDQSYLPPSTCCDRFSYLVTVDYADGTSEVVLTMDGAKAPDVLWKVIYLTLAIGTMTTVPR